MSFEFRWPKFSPSFYDDAKRLLSTALNKGDKPAIIADPIEVNRLDMGTIPPDLEILEIGDLGRDRFRGIFRMTYTGDASICLQTKVQVNPLRQSSTFTTPDILTTPPILFASTPLIVPMTLSLSNLKLRAIVVLVISRLEGVTLVFKNDPLESVQVSSTFDSLAAIQTFLQSEIERQLRDLFRTELPGIIHQLSRRWLKRENTHGQPQAEVEPISFPSTSNPSTQSVPVTPSTHNSTPLLSVPDEIESYDPTYGLRPSHPPLRGCFSNYRSLIKQKGRKVGLSVVLTGADDEKDGVKEETLADPSAAAPHPSPQSPTSPSSVPKNCMNQPIKPKIFHSHSAGIINPDLSSSGLSSHYGHEGTRNSVKVLDSQTPPKIGKYSEETIALQRNHEEEGELLRSRRLERFSMQSYPASLTGLSTKIQSSTQSQLTQTKRPEQLRMQTSPIRSLRTHLPPRPPSSIFPSPQRSSMTSLPPYASHCASPVGLPPVRSPIFLSSGSASSTDEFIRSAAEDIEESSGFDGGETAQCALLASLVRGNWTLSPFSRSISHFAARSTPLRNSQTSSDSSSLSSPTRLSSNPFNHLQNASFYPRDEPFINHDHHHSSSSANLHADGFKQKRVTKINKKATC